LLFPTPKPEHSNSSVRNGWKAVITLMTGLGGKRTFRTEQCLALAVKDGLALTYGDFGSVTLARASARR
jgi:hypothetical protein